MFTIKTDLVIINEESIKNKMYYIRGKMVMIDSDLAEIYGYTTKAFNQQVQRNIERFDNDFRFELTNDEVLYLSRSQNVTTMQIKGIKGGRVYNPYVFTEEGIYMLMTVLKGEKAIKQSKMLIRIFKSMKDYLIDNKILKQDYINNMVFKHENKIEYIDNSIKLLQESFDKLEEKKEVNEIYFNGKIYDAYSKIKDIFKESKKELIIVDRYTDKTLLDMIKDLKSNVILITSNKSNITKLDLDKYNKTYNNLKIYYNDLFHDRYIIIDKEKIYHSGNSINHIGFRKSSIDVINDENVKNQIIKDINVIIKFFNA